VPLAHIRRTINISDAMMEEILPRLASIIADALNIPDTPGALVPDDIEFEVVDSGKFDTKKHDFSMTIFANEYPERAANLDERREKIQADLASLIPQTLSYYVWPLLSKGSFGAHIPPVED
jgi:hypothetical protein